MNGISTCTGFGEDSLDLKAKEESHRKGIGGAGLLAIGGIEGRILKSRIRCDVSDRYELT